MLKDNLKKPSGWILLGVPLAVGLIVYIMNLTKSALWYDEAIEYFYSKYMFGAVPGGGGVIQAVCMKELSVHISRHCTIG